MNDTNETSTPSPFPPTVSILSQTIPTIKRANNGVIIPNETSTPSPFPPTVSILSQTFKTANNSVIIPNVELRASTLQTTVIATVVITVAVAVVVISVCTIWKRKKYNRSLLTVMDLESTDMNPPYVETHKMDVSVKSRKHDDRVIRRISHISDDSLQSDVRSIKSPHWFPRKNQDTFSVEGENVPYTPPLINETSCLMSNIFRVTDNSSTQLNEAEALEKSNQLSNKNSSTSSITMLYSSMLHRMPSGIAKGDSGISENECCPSDEPEKIQPIYHRTQRPPSNASYISESDSGTFEGLITYHLPRREEKNGFDFDSDFEEVYFLKPDLPDTINPELCVWGHFTEEGGILEIKNTDVSLFVPKMALPTGSSQLIYIGLMNRKGLYPELEEGQSLLSPTVICGPDGLQFEKPVLLTLPHSAPNDDVSSFAPKVYSCSTVPQRDDDGAAWKPMEDPENNDESPLAHVNTTSMKIMINHFTGFVVVGRPTEQITKWVVPFCTSPEKKVDCSVRIYCIPATKAALEELRLEEKALNGSQSDARKQINISNNNKDIHVVVEKVRPGWQVDEEWQAISFKDVWQAKQNFFPSATFTFELDKKDQLSFSCSFSVKQDVESASPVILKISSSIQQSSNDSEFASLPSRSSSHSSGISSISYASSCTYRIRFSEAAEDLSIHKIPLNIRGELCFCLDIERDDFHDYRMFAEHLGFKIQYINWLKRQRSPTNEIIEVWEKELSEEIPLNNLIDFLARMERFDAVDILCKIK